jgi:hypothetical protein
LPLDRGFFFFSSSIGDPMDRYLAYWRRGWWAWLLVLCLNFSLIPLIAPAALVFSDNKALYWAACFVLWSAVGAPVWGWLFEVFARNSERLSSTQSQPSQNAPIAAVGSSRSES